MDEWTGIRKNVAHDEYHTRVLGVASKGVLDLVHRSPLHYRTWVDGHDEEPEGALKFGQAFHCAALEPDLFERAYACEPDFGDCRFKANKAERDAWRKAHDGAVALTHIEMTTVRGMVDAVRRHPLAGRMIRDGEAELTVRWIDQETGLRCKCRADYYVPKHRMVLDLKSTEDARKKPFRHDILRYRYHVQDALYRAGFGAVGASVDHFVFVAVEKRFPHAIAIHSLDATLIARGYEKARRDMRTLAECFRADKWPGYPETIQTIEAPAWDEDE